MITATAGIARIKALVIHHKFLPTPQLMASAPSYEPSVSGHFSFAPGFCPPSYAHQNAKSGQKAAPGLIEIEIADYAVFQHAISILTGNGTVNGFFKRMQIIPFFAFSVPYAIDMGEI
jgi:hypothetical protein